jgi:DNA-binding XRE family transcriptional regulator
MKKKKVKATPKNYSRLGINIQHLRENRRETQEELGAAIGVEC